MKIISKGITIILSIIIILTLLAVSTFLFVPQIIINIGTKTLNTSKPFENTLVISLSAEDKDVMDDIYLKNVFVSDNSVNETYQLLNLNMASQDFEWEKFYKFNTLQVNTPFDGRSLEFKDVDYYKLQKPDTTSTPILHQLAIDNISEMSFVDKNILGKNVNGAFGFRYDFEVSGDVGTDILKQFFNKLKTSPSFDEFFTENQIVEKALIFEDGTSGLKGIVDNLIENSMVGKLSIRCDIYSYSLRTVTMTVDFDYVVDNKPIPMTLYVTQDFKNIEEQDISQKIWLSSLTNIEELKPDTYVEDKYGHYEDTNTMIDNPAENAEMPGVILSEEYQKIAGGD